MNSYCKECGAKLDKEHNVCTNCGTKIERTESRQEITKDKKKKTKRPVLAIAIGVILIIAIAFGVWFNMNHSAKGVEKRFKQALEDKDEKELKNLLTHENKSEVSPGEVKGFIELTKDKKAKKKLERAAKSVEVGKKMGMLPEYKMRINDTYVHHTDHIDGAELYFNDEKIKGKADSEFDDELVFGPLIPGVYDVKVSFELDEDVLENEEEITILGFQDKYHTLHLSVDATFVDINLENYDKYEPFSPVLKLRDEVFEVKDGGADSVGPVVLGESSFATLDMELPWGETTAKIPLDSEEINYEPTAFVESELEAYEEIATTLGESWVQTQADGGTDELKDVSKEVKAAIDDIYEPAPLNYSGKVTEILIDPSSTHIAEVDDDIGVQITAQYNVEQSYHEISGGSDLTKDSDTLFLYLKYNKEEESWTLYDVEQTPITLDDVDGIVRIEGSNTLYEPSEEAKKATKDSDLNEELESFISQYLLKSIEAINSGDFSIMESYLTENGPRRKEAEDYLDYLGEKGITEEFHGTEIEEFTEVDADTIKVTTIDTISIFRTDSSDQEKKFKTTVLLKKDGNSYLVDELVKTDPL